MKHYVMIKNFYQVLQARVEKVITEFNKAMEESPPRMEKLKMIVMK